MMAASVTHPVPWTSSLKHAILGRQPKVLKVNVRPRVQRPRGAHKGIHKLVVSLSPNPLLPETEVQLVAEQMLIVRPAVQHDGQAATGVDARAERGENELGHGNEHSAYALVAYS
ncbi:hypothetical protein J3459_012558 [Metarhizium acridum]|nr:hypothetical protein J3459_012558 [Metarhizium acridum]